MKIMILSLLVITFWSCRNTTSKQNNSIDFEYWNWLEIAPENQEITIFYDSDTAKVRSWKMKDTMDNVYGRYRVKRDIKIEKFILNKSERDSIFQLSYEMIQSNLKPKEFCTDYCGHVAFRLNSDQVTMSKYYSSICNWKRISKETYKIHSILSKKVKINTSSDCLSDEL